MCVGCYCITITDPDISCYLRGMLMAKLATWETLPRTRSGGCRADKIPLAGSLIPRHFANPGLCLGTCKDSDSHFEWREGNWSSDIVRVWRRHYWPVATAWVYHMLYIWYPWESVLKGTSRLVSFIALLSKSCSLSQKALRAWGSVQGAWTTNPIKEPERIFHTLNCKCWGYLPIYQCFHETSKFQPTQEIDDLSISDAITLGATKDFQTAIPTLIHVEEDISNAKTKIESLLRSATALRSWLTMYASNDVNEKKKIQNTSPRSANARQ